MPKTKTTSTPESTVYVIYCRVSSDKQAQEDKGSLDAQERNGVRKAAELGLHVLYVVKDAESAWVLDKRSKFRVVLNDAKSGKFRVLIVDRMNRFTRSEDLSEYMEVMTELKVAGIRLVLADKDYEATPTGQLLMTMDAWQSAIEQANRKAQSLTGKSHRVNVLQRPIPGSRPPYGYYWVDAKKTRLEKSGDEAQKTVERIWRYFLHADHPTLRGMAMLLTGEGVRSPRAYQGIKNSLNRWNAEVIRLILANPIYWGGTVKTFSDSKHYDPVEIPNYAPAYVTPDEAARVHALLQSNQHYAARNRKREWGTLLHGGLAKCGECGWTLTVHANHQDRKDGSRLLMYRCAKGTMFGKHECRGGSISTEALDYAVIKALNDNLNGGEFLHNLFAAWDRDAEETHTAISNLKQTLDEVQEQIANGTARLLHYAPNDPLAAPVEAHICLLQEQVPGLQDRLRRAREAAAVARNNPALRAELAEWFDGWMYGFYTLPTARQRQFLFAIQAKVLVWREGAHTPRVQVHIALPTAPLSLPPDPWSTLHQVATTGGWTLDVDDADIALGRRAREIVLLNDDGSTTFGRQPDPKTETAEGMRQFIKRELELDRFEGAQQEPQVVSSSYRRPKKGEAASR